MGLFCVPGERRHLTGDVCLIPHALNDFSRIRDIFDMAPSALPSPAPASIHRRGSRLSFPVANATDGCLGSRTT